MQRSRPLLVSHHLLMVWVALASVGAVSTSSHASNIRKVAADGSITLTNTGHRSHSGRSGGQGQYAYVMQNDDGEKLLTNITRRTDDDRFRDFNQQVKKTFYPESNIHQYKNWGANEAAVSPSGSRNKNAYDALIADAARRHNLDAGLMKAIMHTESGFNANARSPVGAQGLMQLMPATARRFGVTNAWDPAQNIEGSAKYLRWLLNRFNGRVEHVLAGYNAGEGNVDKYGGIPPFRETQDYVKRVLSRYNNLYANQSFQPPSRHGSNNSPISLTANTTHATSDSAYTQTALAALGAPR